MSVTYGRYASQDSTYGTKCRSIVGQAKVTFGNFDLAKKHYVQFRVIDDDQFSLTLYKDKKYVKIHKIETFGGSDLCGLDWGTCETQKVYFKLLYMPPKLNTYVTIINRTKSISLLFPKDVGVQMNYWKNELKDLLYGAGGCIRESLRYGGETVLLQAGKRTLCLTNVRCGMEPARVRRDQCWDKGKFHSCYTTGRFLYLHMETAAVPSRVNVMQLECERSGMLYGQIRSQEDIVRRIRWEIYNWAVAYRFTDITFYDGLRRIIEEDEGNGYYDLNELQDFGTAESQMGNTLLDVGRKCKENARHFTSTEIRAATTGYILSKIKANPPDRDTLQLPKQIRSDICLRLYDENARDVSGGDWKGLASAIGK